MSVTFALVGTQMKSRLYTLTPGLFGSIADSPGTPD